MVATKRKIIHDDSVAEDVDILEEEVKRHDTKRPKIGEPDRPDFDDRSRYKECAKEIEAGIILRKYYPPEISNARCKKYATGQIDRPITTLNKAIASTHEQRDRVEVGDCVIHWYKCDLRLQDNKALSLASQKAKSQGVPLICIYLVSPQDFRAHVTADVRVDFILRCLALLKTKLAELDIPLYVETIEKRKQLPARLQELCKEWGARHVYCNIEYEVDELNREALLTKEMLDNGISFNAVHDTCVVEPGPIKSGKGEQMSVYSPWFKKWCDYVNTHPDSLKEYEKPGKNPASARDRYKKLFEKEIPEAPEDKSLTQEEKDRLRPSWPVGEGEAHNRLQKFISEKMRDYAECRNVPNSNGTSMLSVHLASGTLASRTCIREAVRASKVKKIVVDRSNGAMMWISEVAWRDFYKHVLAAWPFVCMNKCFKPEYTDIEWEYNKEHFQRWADGKTGYPFVDAAMRQVRGIAYMHNRVRMVVASFLAKDLMIDWRMGEKWFMENLIDGDFASNNGGWGFSASCGVDPQPYFRIFNPTTQGEKFDATGEYIRKWVPELREIKDSKAIHDPYNRGAAAIAKKNGYPPPMVDHKFARERALTRYKAVLKKEGI